MRYLLIIISLFAIGGCSLTNDTGSNNNDETTEQEEGVKENIISFGELDVSVGKTEIRIEGEAKAKYDQFYFTLEQDDEILLNETEVELGEDVTDEWREFEFKVDIGKEELNEEKSPFLMLYSKEDGEARNKHFVPVDLTEY